MAVIQKFEWIWPEGTTPVSLYEWIATLPQEQQDEFYAGEANTEILRQQAIDAGLMTLANDGSYIWRDQEAFNINKQNDIRWQRYWQQWQDETGVKFRSYLEQQ